MQIGFATARTFTATVFVNNVANPISILGSAAQSFTTLLAELDADLTDATSAIDGNGNVTITATNTGESIFIVDGDLFKNTQDQLRLDVQVTSEAVSYTMTVEVDGVDQQVVIAGENADTFTNFVAELTAALTGADAAIDADNNIVITTDTAGNGGSIRVNQTQDGIFPLTNQFFGYRLPRVGATTFLDLMFLGRDFGGDLFFFKHATRGIGSKPPVGNTSNTSTAVYFDGVDWVRLVDDVAI